jgi:hypothetical protein
MGEESDGCDFAMTVLEIPRKSPFAKIAPTKRGADAARALARYRKQDR